MVLELKIPELPENFDNQAVLTALLSLLPKLFSYLLSFVVVAILWINHHSLFEKFPIPPQVWCGTMLFYFL